MLPVPSTDWQVLFLLLPPIVNYRGLELENNTVGILVSTAVELNFGERHLKPAGKNDGAFACIFVSEMSLLSSGLLVYISCSYEAFHSLSSSLHKYQLIVFSQAAKHLDFFGLLG